jgi:NADH-quinone oxidoreductase subunit G
MVVHTQTARVRHAQEAVVEFLLINHPLDCPVCDKGGECPLQDISFGWGGGRSRFIEPKRHFVKPLALSPLVAIDRERCILCYRCVRFSQEIAEDYQLVLAGARRPLLRRRPSTAIRTSRRSAATSSSCARWAR